MSIPCLELSAAVLLAYDFLHARFSSISRDFLLILLLDGFYSHSRLDKIAKWNSFEMENVANHVDEVQIKTLNIQWHYVPFQSSSAD